MQEEDNETFDDFIVMLDYTGNLINVINSLCLSKEEPQFFSNNQNCKTLLKDIKNINNTLTRMIEQSS